MWGIKVAPKGPKARSWALDVSPLQSIYLKMGKADQHVDSLSYGLTLGNMNQIESKKDLSGKN